MSAVLAAAALAACGSENGSTSTQSPTAASPTPSGPASADLTFVGDPALTAPLSKVSIECLVPALDGTYILVNGVTQAQPAGGVTLSVGIRNGSVTVNVGSGSGASLVERNFSGTGTSAFDAAKGVHLTGALTETTPATVNKGTLGALTAISGSVKCGDQTMGTSTIRVTGSTAEGALDLTLHPARVVCRNGASGYFIGVRGLTTVAGAQALVFVTLGQTSLSVAVERQGGPNHFFAAQGSVGTSVSSTGGHVDGNAAEQGATGAPGTVQVTGDATCGSSATY